jgi:acyl carrier protein
MNEETVIEDPERTVRDAVQLVLDRKGSSAGPVAANSRLAEDLELDSLDLAELSAALEDELGHDPYSAGIVPRTVGEIVAYYQG